MTRGEQREKLFFLQMSTDFMSELPIRRLLRASAGDTMFRIYMQAHCVALKTGGVLELHAGIEPAEEIALLIGSPATEVPMIATTMQHCQAYGLISTDEEDKIINFSLTPEYTRAWTRDAIARREKREAERLEAAENVPAIEDKGAEEPEKKPSNKAKAQAAADEMFERLWRQYPKKKDKSRVKPATRYKLYKEYGEEKCQRALDAYRRECNGRDTQYILNGGNFFNVRIFDLLDGDNSPDQGFSQYMAPPVTPVNDDTVKNTILKEGIFDTQAKAWDRTRFEEVRPKLSPDMAAAIEAKMGQI